MENDKSLFFLTLSLSCIWVVLDNIWGKKHLQTFLSNLFPFIDEPAEVIDIPSQEFYEEKQKELEYDDKGNVYYDCPFCDFHTTDGKELIDHGNAKHKGVSK